MHLMEPKMHLENKSANNCSHYTAFLPKIQSLEIGKNNRIEQTRFLDLNTPANPHDYWIFGYVSYHLSNMISSAPRYGRFATSP